MAASSAALRLLLRRRGSAPAPPSLALLQPLFHRPFSTRCSPLLPAAASAGLLDVRRAQVSPASEPYLLRRYSSKPSMGSAPQQAAGGMGTPCQKQVKQHRNIVANLKTWLQTQRFLNAQKELLKRREMLNEALETVMKANDLLDEWWDDRAVAMFENELENTWKALVAYEKAVDNFAKAVGGSNGGLPVDVLEQYQTLCKQMKDTNKSWRQSLEKVSDNFKKMKMLLEVSNAEFFSPFETLKMLTITTVRLGTCLLLTLVIVRAYLT